MSQINALRLLLNRFFNKQFIRFLAIGGANTLATYIVYLAILRWVSYPFAYTLSMILGIIFAYLGNTIFVFKTAISWSTFLQYPLIYAIQYLMGLALFLIEIQLLGISDYLAPLINVMLMIPFTYLMNQVVLKRNAKHV